MGDGDLSNSYHHVLFSDGSNECQLRDLGGITKQDISTMLAGH